MIGIWINEYVFLQYVLTYVVAGYFEAIETIFI